MTSNCRLFLKIMAGGFVSMLQSIVDIETLSVADHG